jgi:NADPH:quinone reductase-like Zn-dependent oxidoreductase
MAVAGPVPLSGGSSPSLPCMRAVQITRFGGPEVLDVVDVPEPVPGDGQRLYEVSTAGINFADTHHRHSPQQRIA